MRKNLGRDLTVGAVVLIAALIFTLGIFWIGSEQSIWVQKVTYKIRLPDANGLQRGTPVRLAGVQVGAITDIRFADEPDVANIVVDLSIDRSHQHRMRRDTKANIHILSLLGGEKYVELTPGSPSEPEIEPGTFITVPEGFSMSQLGELSAGLAEDLRSISGNVRIILETVQRQEGVIGRMLLDPTFGEEVFKDIGESSRHVRETLEGISEGKGLAGRILKDEAFAKETTESIRASLGRIEEILAKMTDQEGVIYRALDPNGKVAGSIDNLSQATADLRDFTADLKEGGGTLGRLVSDEKLAEELLGNVRQISRDLASITSKLDRGEGTLGAFINDPQLYQDIVDVMGGVKNSKVVTWLIRHYREKGEKDRAKEEEKLREEGTEDGAENGGDEDGTGG